MKIFKYLGISTSIMLRACVAGAGLKISSFALTTPANGQNAEHFEQTKSAVSKDKVFNV